MVDDDDIAAAVVDAFPPDEDTDFDPDEEEPGCPADR
jgi:hypothetical protein